ncbi:MAG TPA: hypothetical protein VHW68_05620 [Actinomycetota bacterium]|jgi:hypothetical protein|nr:hypothetical protein [Actinomycetota bacterium]
MPNDERGHNFRNQQEGLRDQGRGGSANDSMSARTLTIALAVVIGLFIALMFALVFR